jgi:hypothetical protein
VKLRDLVEFGLPLIASDAPEFPGLLEDIRSRPQPFGGWPMDDLSSAAVLLNQSGKAIVTLSYIWRFTDAAGKTRTSRYSNLGSSTQFDLLCGRGGVVRDLGTFILPGSKRLITMRGMFGNNLDVLKTEEIGRGGGYMGAGGGGLRGQDEEEMVETELALDVVIFEDGVYAGPDETGIIAGLTEELTTERETARNMLTALLGGASPGRIFEMVQPLARHHHPQTQLRASAGYHPTALRMFANHAIHQLVQGREGELQGWLEQTAESTPIHLRRG